MKFRFKHPTGVSRRAFCQAMPLCFIGGSSALTGAALAGPSGPLENFFSNVKTLRAAFHQSVLTEELELIDQSQGELWLSRPGRFRWNYGTPLEQVVVAPQKGSCGDPCAATRQRPACVCVSMSTASALSACVFTAWTRA